MRQIMAVTLVVLMLVACNNGSSEGTYGDRKPTPSSPSRTEERMLTDEIKKVLNVPRGAAIYVALPDGNAIVFVTKPQQVKFPIATKFVKAITGVLFTFIEGSDCYVIKDTNGYEKCDYPPH